MLDASPGGEPRHAGVLLASGISHFEVLLDDLRMNWLYAPLALRMPTRARRLVARRVGQPR